MAYGTPRLDPKVRYILYYDWVIENVTDSWLKIDLECPDDWQWLDLVTWLNIS